MGYFSDMMLNSTYSLAYLFLNVSFKHLKMCKWLELIEKES